MEQIWKINSLTQEQTELRDKLASELNISQISAQLLVTRGITTSGQARAYIKPSLQELHDPFLMKDMDKAVERLQKTIQENERILIYGDYDVDGTTAVAAMYVFLQTLTSNIDFYIPDRYKEGYGISFQGIDYAKENNCTLIIALDCGIKSVDKVKYANQYGIDFIICDHHLPGVQIPEAIAVLDMKRQDCDYPYKELSGCGVGFKLIQAYCLKHNSDSTVWKKILQLLALSIASDVVPVTGENRVLAYYGLKQINSEPCIGIKALMQVAGMENKTVVNHDLVFKIGPRINACGRMHSGREAVKLLITEDKEYALKQALEIDEYNSKRKILENQTTQQALEQLAKDPDNQNKHTTVVYNPDWHKGVIGIVASRLTETFYRPTIVFTSSGDGIATGSARSVGDFDIYTAIDAFGDLLTNYGGHVFAAGLSLEEAKIPEFKQKFEQYVSEHITVQQQQKTITIDANIKLSDITPQLINVIKHLEPLGESNPQPVFMSENLINNYYTKQVGNNGEHLKLSVKDDTAGINGIAFGKGEWAEYIQEGHKVNICYELEENTFNGVTRIQMVALDIKNNEE